MESEELIGALTSLSHGAKNQIAGINIVNLIQDRTLIVCCEWISLQN
jgi:hypothetical protein